MSKLRQTPTPTPTTTILIILLLLVSAAGLSYLYQRSNNDVTNFEECKAAGYPIQESYPEVCRTEDGRSFSNPNQPPEGSNLNP
jgi:hypothetical protein